MSEQQPCPHCGNPADQLRTLSEAILNKLAENGTTGIPNLVCTNCYQTLAGSIAQGAVLLAEHKAKEQKKMMMWKSRVSLIKKARLLMREKAFADSAVAYEKYLKVLETVYDCKPNELTPEHLKNTARTQELTVIASVYWDLLRIYDTSEKYAARMDIAAKKLSEFLPLTPLYPDIVKKAESFAKSAKKPGVIKNFLKSVSDSKGRCFIATSAFQSTLAPEVIWLQQWRDYFLLPSPFGNKFILFYYKHSPTLANSLDKLPFLKPLVRLILRVIIFLIKVTHPFFVASSYKKTRNRKDEFQ